MRSYTLFLFAANVMAFIVFSCQKKDLEDPANYIRGKVLVKNEDTMELQSIDKTKMVLKLSTDNQNNEFLYSVSPDKEGYFIFKLPVNDLKKEYHVFCNYQSAEGVIYKGTGKFVNQGDTGFAQGVLVISPDYNKQNFLYLRVADNMNQNVGNCSLYVYTNLLASANSFTSNPTFTLSADANGIYKKIGFTPGTFYVNAYKDFGNGMVLKRKSKVITVKNTGAVVDSITLY